MAETMVEAKEKKGLKEEPIFTAILNGINAVPGLRQILLLVGLAASVAIGVSIVMWAKEPGYQTLYAGLDQQAAAQVVEMLQSMNVEYKLDRTTGEILVPFEKLHEIRLKLAGEGVPGDGGQGIEMISEEKGMGVSQFIEGKRYHHALEVELSRTINSLQPVQKSRVHLALPKRSVFLRDQQSPSASVLVNLYPGQTLSKSQVVAIVNLVASSIPDMDAGKVTVIDQRGQLLSQRDENDELVISTRQFEYRQKIEDTYVKRIEQLLFPVMGANRVRAEVSADIDFSRIEMSRESYNPDQVVRSEQVNIEPRIAADQAAGVPGSLANQPPQAGGADNKATESAPLGSASYVTRNYEVGKTMSYTNQPAGNIKRLSVAVLVGNQVSTDADGNPVTTELTQVELDKLTALVRDAVGFDGERGDRVTVMNANFISDEVLEAHEPSLMDTLSTPAMQEMIKQGMAALLVLVLIMTIFRPVMKGLLQSGKNTLPAIPEGMAPDAAAAYVAGMQAAAGPDVHFSVAGMPSQLAPPGGLANTSRSFEEKLAVAKGTVAEDPKRAVQVMRSWVAENHE